MTSVLVLPKFHFSPVVVTQSQEEPTGISPHQLPLHGEEVCRIL